MALIAIFDKLVNTLLSYSSRFVAVGCLTLEFRSENSIFRCTLHISKCEGLNKHLLYSRSVDKNIIHIIKDIKHLKFVLHNSRPNLIHLWQVVTDSAFFRG